MGGTAHRVLQRRGLHRARLAGQRGHRPGSAAVRADQRRARGRARARIGVVTAVSFLVTAVAAVGWAYAGDRTNRKPLLMVGTLIWAAGAGGSASPPSYAGVPRRPDDRRRRARRGRLGRLLRGHRPDLAPPPRPGDELLGAVPGRRHAGRHAGRRPARRRRLAAAVPGARRRRPGRHAWPTCSRTTSGAGRASRSWPRCSPPAPSTSYRISRADLPGILAPADQRLAGPAGADRAGRVRLAGLAAPAVPGQGRGAGLLDGPPRSLVGSVFATLFQLGGVLSIVGGLVGDRCSGAPRAAGPWSRRSASSPPCRSTWCCSSCRCHRRARGASAGAVVAAVLAGVVTEPTVGLSLLTACVALGADLGQLAELVRADRRRQPARAPRHRLQPGQPGQRGRPGGRQRPGRRPSSAGWRAASRRR